MNSFKANAIQILCQFFLAQILIQTIRKIHLNKNFIESFNVSTQLEFVEIALSHVIFLSLSKHFQLAMYKILTYRKSFCAPQTGKYYERENICQK